MELMDKYLELENKKDDLRRVGLKKEGYCDWDKLDTQLERMGVLEEYKECEEKQTKLLGCFPYYSDFGDNETKFVFEWLKSLIEERAEE